jgi:hypothetical protein
MSTIHEALKLQHGEPCAEQRLKVLRAELRRPVVTVKSAVSLLKQIDADVAQSLPASVSREEFEHVITWLGEAGADLEEILNVLAEECPEAVRPESN